MPLSKYLHVLHPVNDRFLPLHPWSQRRYVLVDYMHNQLTLDTVQAEYGCRWWASPWWAGEWGWRGDVPGEWVDVPYWWVIRLLYYSLWLSWSACWMMESPGHLDLILDCLLQQLWFEQFGKCVILSCDIKVKTVADTRGSICRDDWNFGGDGASELGKNLTQSGKQQLAPDDPCNMRLVQIVDFLDIVPSVVGRSLLLAGINMHNVLTQLDYPDLFLCIQNAVTHGSSVSPHSPIINAGSVGPDNPHGQMMSHDVPHQAMHSMGDPAFTGHCTPTPLHVSDSQ